MSATLKPIGDRVLLREIREAVGLTPQNGIVLPDAAIDTHNARNKDELARCEVLAIGPGKSVLVDGEIKHLSVEAICGHALKIGDVVLAQRFWGVHKFRGTKVKLMGADDIVAVEEA